MKLLIKKEIHHFYLKNPLVVFLNIGLVLFLVPTSIFPVFSIHSNISSVALGLHKIIPAMLIVLLGLQLTAVQFYGEKMNKNLEVLLALGYDPIKIWFCKIVSIWMMIYFFYLIGISFAFVILPLISSEIMQSKQFTFYLNLILLSPLLGLSILGLISVVQLYFEDIRVINISLTLGIFLFIFFLPQISKIIPLAGFIRHFSVASMLISAFFVSMSLVILRVIPTERFLR